MPATLSEPTISARASYWGKPFRGRHLGDKDLLLSQGGKNEMRRKGREVQRICTLVYAHFEGVYYRYSLSSLPNFQLPSRCQPLSTAKS